MKAVYSIIFLIGFIVASNKKLVAQEYYRVSAREKSLAGIVTCLSDGWSAFGNQAGMVSASHPEAGISYSNYFLLKELGLKAAYASMPVGENIFAVTFYRFGNELYSENKLGLAYAREIIPGFSAGFQFNYFFIHLPENEKSPGISVFEGGIQYRLNEKLLIGAHCFNPFQSRIETESVRYKLPCLFRLGIGTTVTEGLLLFCEMEKDLKQELLLKFGAEYRILDKFQVRGGLAGKNNLLTLGLAYSSKKLRTDFSWQYNYRLGSIPSVAISYTLK
ncbi:MAG: hypothetical protein A2W90_13690 [Bacteroidetes bacterium GWF2_42_66]|nr:MAG: hypothetical protein A2W92_14405 [Bacteroidetes bacterium GWA2_42_15]OFX97311.1 MAG: hypothetical protein A2W89_00865 [Bacteroidetes bacterium GWE2_42_39]OFY39948.1 MAG: hypothetical protein A2W90_13690 [Bacteroidetes bacterium GWF2_42_66]HBL78134.1 hypothetical protein [Prolixibacteraceae bacterium]HCR91892.1 hypothetical protein [Prolixibacteraceae bacterium]